MSHDTTEMLEITNSCTCETWDDQANDFVPTTECWGHCWETMLEDFECVAYDLLSENETNEWRIDDFPVWNGKVSGVFEASNARQLLERITPSRTEWRLAYKAHKTHLECVLWHHDAPMGGRMIVAPRVNEEEVK